MGARLSAGLGGAGLTDTRGEEPLVARFAAMGTRVELHLFGAGDAMALDAARRAIEAVDDALTIHRPSATTELNDRLAADGVATITDPIVFETLASVQALVPVSRGLFDPAVGGMPGAGWDMIDLDRDARRVRARAPVAFDFGGIGKGIALDRATAALRDAGVTSAFLSAGESSIATIGRHPLGGPWPVGVPDPFDAAHFLIELALENEALSISATVGSGAQAPSRSATIHPASGEPVQEQRLVAAIAATGAEAEVMSTALLAADDADGIALLAASPDRRFAFRFERGKAIALYQAEDGSR